MKRYFISYYFRTKYGGEGHGCREVTSTPIRSMSDLLSIRDTIIKQNDYKDMIILNWCPFETDASAPATCHDPR
jgi:hypothetical protein